MQKSKLKNQRFELKITNFKTFKFCFVILPFAFYLFTFTGCATAPLISPPKPEFAIPGIYHRVERGQTLWRISKIYNVDLDEIVKINRVSDATSIEVGQLIFIPHYQQQPTQQYTPSRYSAEDFIWPLRGKVIATFGQTFSNMINKGINIQPYGVHDVVATRSGKVIFYADDFQGFGKTIIIDHGDGLSSIYARNAQVFIKIGDTVQKGTPIAKAGSAGRDNNVYLHFEIRKGHIPQNPYFYLPR